MTRLGLAGAIALTAALALGAAALGSRAQAEETVIKVVAKKFDFTPDTIKLKKGVPVTLELTSADVLMGFNAPDLKVRSDVVPGKTMRVRIVPDKAGTFTFFCDVFCGSGHEEMTGTIIVE